MTKNWRTAIPIKQDNLYGLEENVEVVFLIHGWMENRGASWYEELTDAFLSRKDKVYNIIQVDWSGPAGNLVYPVTVEDTKIIGTSN